jgi:glycosyltransferase involved in cell wall biosynthesis
MPATEPATDRPEVSIIVPARNEEVSVGGCLESLMAQTGIGFEIIVVDDHSTDRTREIAECAARGETVRVIEADPLQAGWTGKNNAVATGARAARGQWLLFTDADTVHLPGSLARAVREMLEHKADMLSYSPEQITVTFWEMATIPVIFAQLAGQYPPSKVSHPTTSMAAANGQYLLLKREVYDAIGGHAAVAADVLEDVALARLVKRSGRKLRFRYAADAVRTRMYRNFGQLQEGWTKNLALLFPEPGKLALKVFALWAVAWGAFLLALTSRGIPWWWRPILLFGGTLYLTARLNRANCGREREILGAIFGMPMFAYLLLRSKRAHAGGKVSWKGRTYPAPPPSEDQTHSISKSSATEKLATEN